MTEKREVVETMVKEGYPIMKVCDMLGLSRSTYYYQPVQADENGLQSAIEELAGQYPTYGTRRITHQLRRPPYRIHVNRKRVQRVMAEQKLLRPQKRYQKRTTDSQHPYPRYRNLVKDLEICYPDQVWVSDVTYIRLQQDFVYLAIIMDVYTRVIRGWHLSRSLDQALTLTALRRALVDHAPAIHHSDQGVQYAAHEYIDLLADYQVQISMADQGEAWQNGYAERLMRTIKEEEVYLSDYQDYADAYRQIGQFLEDVYNHKRIHSALGYLTPVEFEIQWQARQLTLEGVH